MDKQALIAEAWRMARFAHNSFSMNLIYEAHGFVKGIVDSGIVTYHEVADIDSFICRDSINNGKWIQEVEKRERAVYTGTYVKQWPGEYLCQDSDGSFRPGVYSDKP